MSYETARYILWALMCVPVLWLGLHLINSVINDTLDIKRRNATRRKKIAEERKQQEILKGIINQAEEDLSMLQGLLNETDFSLI